MSKLKKIIVGLFIAFVIAALAFFSKSFVSKPVLPIVFTNLRDTVINGLVVSNTSHPCIKLINCHNVTIKNCRLSNSKDIAISLFRCKGISIINCDIENVSTGVYALECQGIQIMNNKIRNVQGPFPRGQMVQFDDVSGSGNSVINNKFENVLGQSYAEDAISMYKSKGTKASPIQITGNLIKGGGPSKTGGGIMLGDYGGEYIIAKNNILVNPGQYGMAISGGSYIQIINNKIYSKRQPFTNVGLYVWKQQAATCGSNIVSGNLVNWTNAAGDVNDSWNNGNCGPVAGWDKNTWRAPIDSTILTANFMN